MEIYPQPELDSPLTRGRFSGKVAIVTGGNSGIGRAIVERFSNDGATVAIFARNVERGEGLARELQAKGGNVKFYQVDVSDKGRCVEAAKQVAEDNDGSVHFLVNNHTCMNLSLMANVVDVSPEAFMQAYSVNVIGTANTVQACYPFMKHDGKNCSIVNISSVSSHLAEPNGSVYNSSKAAINILSKCMALDLSQDGIRVNTVSPGLVWTPLLHDTFGLSRADAEKYASKIHMSRTPIEAAGVASVVAFLCSKDAMYIDGADLPVDCGLTAMGPEGLGEG